MNRSYVASAALALALITMAVMPEKSRPIPKGTDYWVTRPNSTSFTFPAKDVEALCRAAVSSTWDHTVTLQGLPAWGADWDSAVSRLEPAVFGPDGNASTPVQFTSLDMVSTKPSATPCGDLNWHVRLARGRQPVTRMTINRSQPGGGIFHAELKLRVEMQANQVQTGKYVGSLFYDIALGDPASGTPWSFGPQGAFRPGMTATNNCLDVLRQKLGTFPPGSNHIYFISDLIAKGLCKRD